MARYHLEHAHRTRNRVEDSLGCRSDSIAPTVDLVGGNMTRAFSDDLRSRVLAASRDGMSARSAAAWIASARVGQLTPAKKCRRGGSRLDAHEDFIIGMIEEEKDITLNEMVLRLREDRTISIGRSALDVWLRKRGWTFKKRPHMHWSRTVLTS